jgi:hypothetical protein
VCHIFRTSVSYFYVMILTARYSHNKIKGDVETDGQI